jgi:phospholipid/cholesterol/gamma-HCH transport system substrate-binding protein
MRNIKVFMSMKEDVDIPDNSYTTISKSLLGVVQLEINLGNSKRFIKDGDTISARNPSDMIDEAMKKLEPVLTSVAKAANSLDKLLIQAATVFDEGSKNNIKEMLASLNQTASNLKTISSSLESSLDAKNGTLAKTFDNLQSVTGNLKNSNQDISKTLHNLELTTGKFSRMDLEKTLLNLNDAVASLKSTLEKANDTKGSLGLLLNDPALYKNLSATSNKINVLLDDVRTNPRRYVNVSVFGKKNKTQPLQVPMPDTLNAPYLKK